MTATPRITAEAIAKAREMYEKTPASMLKVAQAIGCHKSYIGRKAREQGWVKEWVDPLPIVDMTKVRARPEPLPLAQQKDARVTSDEELIEVIGQLAEGVTLKAACEDAGIKYVTMFERLNTSPELAKIYSRAREIFIQNRVDHMHYVAAREPDVQRARLISDNTKWEASKILHRVYGDSKNINVTGGLQVNDSRDELIKELLQLRGKGASKVLENATDVTPKPAK